MIRSRVIRFPMIVCSCALITDKDIEEAVTALRTNDPLVVLTPGLIYKYLGKRPSCGGCLPLITRLMVAYDDEDPSAQTSPAVRRAAGRSRGRRY
jgi:bacterioferritin-associated ferredoxin